MIRNTCKLNENNVFRVMLEHRTWGYGTARFFMPFLAVVFVSSFIGMFKDVIFIYLFLIYFGIIVLLVFLWCRNYYKLKNLYKDQEYEIIYTIDENKITQELVGKEKTVRTEYPISDITSLYIVKNYSFLYIKGNLYFIIDNNSFTEGSLKELKALVHKKDIVDITNREFFKIVGITTAIGSAFTLLMTIFYLNISHLQEDVFLNSVELMLSGIIFSLIFGFGLAFYIKWYKKQMPIFRILSIILFPISYFAFFTIGMFCMIPYIVKVMWMKYRQRNIA